MKTLSRVLLFGSISGLLWSAVPGTLNELFVNRADVPATVIAGIIAGVAASAVLAPWVSKAGRGITIAFGLLSLPLGAFVFGFAHALISRFFPALTSGMRVLVDPWTLGFAYALLSIISIFAIGLFPLAVVTTFLLRTFIVRGKTTESAAYFRILA